MNNASSTSRPAAFFRFWFTPNDPSMLGFMRIVTGCLVLYVHLVYSVDLTNFFGPHGWNNVESVNRGRREGPIIIGPLDWTNFPKVARVPDKLQSKFIRRHDLNVELEAKSAPVPQYPLRREAVFAYYRSLLEHYPTKEKMNHALRLLDRLQMTADTDAIKETFHLVSSLSKQPDFRRNELAKVRNPADWDRKRDPVAPPRFLNDLKPEERNQVSDEIEDFFLTLPQPGEDADGPNQMRYILNHTTKHTQHKRGRTLEFLCELVEDSPERREQRLKFLEHWLVEDRVADDTGQANHSLWFHLTERWERTTAHVIMLGIMFLFTIGLWTRVTSVLTWLSVLTYINRSQQVLFGMDTMMNILLFYLMIGDCGAALSIDRLIRRYRAAKASLARGGVIDEPTRLYLERAPDSVAAGFAQRLLQVHFCFIYMAAGMSKLKGPAWWNTEAYWGTLANPEFTLINYQWYEELVRALVSHRLVYASMAAVGVALTFIAELGLPFLVWTRLRPYVVIFGLLLHSGVAVFMGLWVFSLLMMTLLLCYLPGSVVRHSLFGGKANPDQKAIPSGGKTDQRTRPSAWSYALDFGQAREVN